jgi:hypothetical protein
VARQFLGLGDGLADSAGAFFERSHKLDKLVPSLGFCGHDRGERASGVSTGCGEALIVLGGELALDSFREALECFH